MLAHVGDEGAGLREGLATDQALAGLLAWGETGRAHTAQQPDAAAPNPTHAYGQWGATPSSCPTHGHRGSGLEILGALLLQAFPKLVERGSSLDP